MIKTFQHKGLKAFFETGGKAGINPDHAPKLKRQLTRLDIAKTADDVNLPGWRLHPQTGNLSGHYSIVVNGNWRITFTFDGEDVVLVDYLDYH
ncbi:type II toxin-antitoxin system RelE/ParE family toxin [Methylomonas methanica]|uniref:Plasmid maintenance system killer n=1 Tax=Methylomonas methanica (strain DSM 25384 / MC09) TaxID=857087 RepID=G0A179_METMM|nr:type II toxin-antitoxin system RelE/ParE family toxin [Methylomonas methanica]AEG02499.1 plasmid maintenance system killer [Methylomonas methanica MC09]